MTRLLSLITLALALAVAAPAQAETRIYKWVDEDGVTQYTQHPPPEGESVVVDPETGVGSRTSRADGDDEGGDDAGDGDAQAADDGDGDTESVAEFCERLRERVALLASDEPIRLREDDTIVTLDDETREERRGRLEAQIAEHCED